MSRKLAAVLALSALTPQVAIADAPMVAVDIAPLHSLVSQVMDGVAEPELIISKGATPHSYALRPSEARALQDANVIFWIGEDLSPWLAGALETVAHDAKSIELLEHPSTQTLEFRTGALFEDGDEDGHDHDHDHHDAHDPHAWLSPENAVVWLDLIATELSAIDPEHADTYRANAATGRAEINGMSAEIRDILQPFRGQNFVVFHDAYQYYETSFDFTASGAISVGDAADPSPARISEIQTRVAEQGVSCVLSEPQFNASLVQTVLDGTNAKTATLDPLGSDLDLGPDLYPQMMRNLAHALAGCL